MGNWKQAHNCKSKHHISWALLHAEQDGFIVDFCHCRRMAGFLIVLPTSTDPVIAASRSWPPSTGYTSWIYANQAALRTGRNLSPRLSTVSAINLRRSCHTLIIPIIALVQLIGKPLLLLSLLRLLSLFSLMGPINGKRNLLMGNGTY